MTDQDKEQEKIDMIIKAMEQAAEEQRNVKDRYESTKAIGKEFAQVVDGAQETTKIYWKG